MGGTWDLVEGGQEAYDRLEPKPSPRASSQPQNNSITLPFPSFHSLHVAHTSYWGPQVHDDYWILFHSYCFWTMS